MARHRTIKPGFHTDQVTGQWPHAAKLTFIGLLNHCDDYGVIRYEPDFFRAVIFPYDRDRRLAEKMIEQVLLPSRRVVEFRLLDMDADGMVSYLWIRNFLKHQKVHTPSEPLLEGWTRETTPDTYPGEVVEPTAEVPPKSRGGPAAGPPPREERRGEEKRGEVTPRGDATSTVWEHYLTYHPRAVLDDKRRKVISDRLREGFTTERLMQAIDGNHVSPFHNGENDRGKPYHDITLILRDAPHVEMFEEMEDPAEKRRREEAERQEQLLRHFNLIPGGRDDSDDGLRQQDLPEQGSG